MNGQGFSPEALKPYRREVEGWLDEVLPLEKEDPASLNEAMRYAVMGGGKRLRPLLALIAGETFGASRTDVAPIAVALELIHGYSLIHDDLPCMDDSPFRRGRPSCHKAFGEATAVLAGDALLTLAFEVIAKGCHDRRLDPVLVPDVIGMLSEAAGSRGMIAGQVLDLAAEGQRIDLETLQRIHRLKTGALFRAALIMGTRVGTPARAELSAMETFADHFGVVFQVTDDILDVVGDFETMGKSPDSDEAREKATFPRLMGLQDARAYARDLTESALGILEGLEDRDTRLLAGLIQTLPNRSS